MVKQEMYKKNQHKKEECQSEDVQKKPEEYLEVIFAYLAINNFAYLARNKNKNIHLVIFAYLAINKNKNIHLESIK